MVPKSYTERAKQEQWKYSWPLHTNSWLYCRTTAHCSTFMQRKTHPKNRIGMLCKVTSQLSRPAAPPTVAQRSATLLSLTYCCRGSGTQQFDRSLPRTSGGPSLPNQAPNAPPASPARPRPRPYLTSLVRISRPSSVHVYISRPCGMP